MSDRDSWTRVGEYSTTVSLVVSLSDDLTDDRPRGDVIVRVQGARPDVVNPSGYRLYFGLPDAEVDVVVDGGDDYVDRRRSVDLSSRDVRTPLQFDMQPTPAYSFPGWATLVRGRVTEGPDDDPVDGAEITIEWPDPSGPPDEEDEYAAWRDRTVHSDSAGQYAYYFPNASASTITDAEGKSIEIDGEDPTISVTHPDGRTETVSTTVHVADVAEQGIDFS